MPAKIRYPCTLERAVPSFRAHLVDLPSPETEYQIAVLADLSRYHLHRVIVQRHWDRLAGFGLVRMHPGPPVLYIHLIPSKASDVRTRAKIT